MGLVLSHPNGGSLQIMDTRDPQAAPIVIRLRQAGGRIASFIVADPHYRILRGELVEQPQATTSITEDQHHGPAAA